MATVFTLLASACPPLTQPSGLLSISAGIPTTRSAVVSLASGAGALSTPFNRNATHADVQGRAGAGAYAIDWDSNPASAVLPGLDLTVSSGLTLAIAAGQAIIDGVIQKLVPTTFVCTDNIARIYLWCSQAGVISAVHNSTTPPGAAYVFLGSVVTSAGAITEINGSGVPYLRAGQLTRQTADLGCPLDSPPAGLSFINHCPGGCWLWTGAEYQNLSGTGRAALSFASNANKTLTAAEANNALLDFSAGVGTPITATRDVIVPLAPGGRRWILRNNADGAQSLRAIGASGAGVTIATAKYAEIISTATDILRLTPDT